MLDLTRERRVSVGDRAWEAFITQARRYGLDTSQALTAALHQWVACAPDGAHCRFCGQVLCENDHHMQWCEDSRNVEATSSDARGGACDIPARPFLAPAEVQQRG
jgi:hypothetical protein